MSLLVNDITYNQAIRTIRELVLDTTPVQCFKVSGQDFVFSKDNTGIAIGGDTYTFSGNHIQKFYDLMGIVRGAELEVEILPDFVATEYSENIVNFSHTPTIDTEDIETEVISRNNYFSEGTINKLMEEFFSYFNPYDGIPKSVETIYSGMDYFNKRKLIYWVAYYLIDRKRMNYASVTEMVRLNDSNSDGTVCGSEGDLKNISTSTTTRVGEVFSVTEKDADDGKGMEGFTSFWGDKYSYFTKLQLWLRDQFERQFKDFSLRDNVMLSQTFTLEKGWENSAWIDTINFSRNTTDILNLDNRV